LINHQYIITQAKSRPATAKQLFDIATLLDTMVENTSDSPPCLPLYRELTRKVEVLSTLITSCVKVKTLENFAVPE